MTKQTQRGRMLVEMTEDTLRETVAPLREAYSLLMALQTEEKSRTKRAVIGAVMMLLARSIHTAEAF
jgi:hypothetical protein